MENQSTPPIRDPKQGLQHFQAIPWINDTWLQNKEYIPFEFANRDDLKPPGVNGFFGQTLHSPSTIPHLFILVKKNITQPEITKDLSFSTQQPLHSPDLIFLAELGPGGLDGWPGMAHGGVSCALVDAATGLTLSALQLSPGASMPREIFTANINVNFLSPVRTGGQAVVVKAWIVARTNAKWLIEAQVVDGKEKVLVSGNSVYAIKGARL